MIRSFRCAATEELFHRQRSRKFRSIERVAFRKLRMLDAATELRDLKSPPSNRLHPLERERAGQHAIWINSQWRICFRWHTGNAFDVEIVDYHD